MNKKKLKKIFKTALVVGLTGIVLFVPNPAPVISIGLLGFWSYILFTEYFSDKKQEKQTEAKKDIPYECYKSDRKEVSKRTTQVDATRIKRIYNTKNNYLEK